MLTIHHFTEPLWFVDMVMTLQDSFIDIAMLTNPCAGQGGFEKESNLKHLVHFAEKIFTEYNRKVKWWCTINEPAVYAFSGKILCVCVCGCVCVCVCMCLHTR